MCLLCQTLIVLLGLSRLSTKNILQLVYHQQNAVVNSCINHLNPIKWYTQNYAVCHRIWELMFNFLQLYQQGPSQTVFQDVSNAQVLLLPVSIQPCSPQMNILTAPLPNPAVVMECTWVNQASLFAFQRFIGTLDTVLDVWDIPDCFVLNTLSRQMEIS
jgi:hypothetical protein